MERKTTVEVKRDQKEEEAKASIDIWKYAFGFVEMAVVKCAIELGIPDALERHGGSMSLSNLASTIACASVPLSRIMRFLVHRRVFAQTLGPSGDPVFLQTALSRLMVKDGERSMAALILLESSPPMLEPWHGLCSRVMANESAPFEAAHNKDIWKYAADNIAHSKLINDAMACNARVAVPATIKGCFGLLDGVSLVVDVGGGDGTALSLLAKEYPWIRGINLDLPHVVAAAPPRTGVEHVGGNMFNNVPNADIAFIMQVLHDWSDEECIEILKKCKEAVPTDRGKIIIVEVVVDEKETNDPGEDVRLMLDMVTLAHTSTGKERTLKEWDFVIRSAGFSRFTVKPIQAVQSVIEAYP